MKICPQCRQTYTDDTLNFCLNDGAVLSAQSQEPRTIVMDQPRTTNQTNWQTPPDAWAPAWREPAAMQQRVTPSINLPIISLTIGVFSLILVCCHLGLILGPAAVITGIISLNQEKRDPERYGGKGIAIGGIVTGAIAFLIGIGFLIIAIIGNIN